MNRKKTFMLACLAALFCLPAAAGAARLDKAAEAIAGELLKGRRAGGATAVVPFRSPEGGISALGGMLADRLTARLLEKKGVTVLDRRYLARVLGEIKLQLSGLTAQDGTAELGRFAGAEFLLLGNFEQLGKKRLAVNARLVETRTGRVAAAARTELKLDDELLELYSRISAADTAAEGMFGPPVRERTGGPAALKVELLLSQETFTAGQTARAVISVSSDSAVYLFSADASGRAARVFPPDGKTWEAEAGRPLLFPGEAGEKEGIFLEAALPPGAGTSEETLLVFAVKRGRGDLLAGAASLKEIRERLETAAPGWAEDQRIFFIHR